MFQLLCCVLMRGLGLCCSLLTCQLSNWLHLFKNYIYTRMKQEVSLSHKENKTICKTNCTASFTFREAVFFRVCWVHFFLFFFFNVLFVLALKCISASIQANEPLFSILGNNKCIYIRYKEAKGAYYCRIDR